MNSDELKDRNILVTGGAGMIGSALVRALSERGANVSVADSLWRGDLENLKQEGKPVIDLNAKFHQVDLTDKGECSRVVKNQEIVFHLADVVAGISYIFRNQSSVYHANVSINTNTLTSAIGAGVKKFIYVGTACSYPTAKQSKVGGELLIETDAYPASPESAYGWSKLMGEYECELADNERLIECGILRLHNVYGRHCDLSMDRSQVIPALIRKALRHPEEKFCVWGSGEQRRAFVHVDDVVSALLAAPSKAMGKGAIQIGPSQSTSIKEVAETIVRLAGKEIEIEYQPQMREGDVDRAADWSKAKRCLGWEPKIGLADGLLDTINWCRGKIRH